MATDNSTNSTEARIEEARRFEREACARIADYIATLYDGQSATHQLIRGTAKKIAERIRKRK